ncbi:hypothetical protein [Geoalkalibacter subterraneus]|nr:hypothetical protein [Geoalkalibacter subterraneus]
MTHAELIQIAERWLLGSKGCSFAFTELKAITHSGEIPDAIGWKSDYTILVECKATRADFLSDKNKKFRKNPHLGMGTFRFYLCPQGVIEPQDLPEKWGLVIVGKKGKPRQVVGPNGNCWSRNSAFCHQQKNLRSETQMMASALRRLHLRGVLPLIYDNPFDSTEERSAASR